MHTDLSYHLHTAECNELIKLLQQCRKDNPFRRFMGYCNTEDHRVVICLKRERLARRKKNYEESIKRKERQNESFRCEEQETA
ncbi:COX assembly mitochondrial protein 2 homolog [Cylas formicarius]|uniref:COX assembly mitochondrial protein 2 homolog n=1 Tax=Cylas formicarius TaxID=197179 RepID=UPI0029587E8D|nr:COX assembly mitochondrial protein 2 homolog [Cylas formicarius]